mmetsp:Transcript_32854/g.63245  ORF Transcript_32854/g.63245 Transcript_32854/m.63245 type:complete len:284 (-) Transcript_32854:607-1458(-)
MMYSRCQLRLSAMSIHMCEHAVLRSRSPVVEVVHPDVGAILDPSLDRDRLVVGEGLIARGIVRLDRRPEHGRAFYGGHRHAEVVEARAASRLGRREVHVEGVHARALRGERGGVLVVVRLVELASLVSQHLERLHVPNRRAGDLRDALSDRSGELVVFTLGVRAPALVARPNGRELVACQASVEMSLASAHKGARLLVADEVPHQHEPRRSRALRSVAGHADHLGRILREITEQPSEGGVYTTGPDERRCLDWTIACSPLFLARAAGCRARVKHVLRISYTLS